MFKWLPPIIIVSLILLTFGCAPEPLEVGSVGPVNGWSVFHPVPGGYHLYAIWGQSPDNVWAVGANGHIVHWNGRETQNIDSPTREDLEFMDAFAPDDIYAATEEDLIHYDGHTWETDDHFPNDSIEGILCGTDERLYIVGSMGVMYRDATGWHDIAGPTNHSCAIWYGPDGYIRVGDLARVWHIDGVYARIEQDFLEGAVIHGSGAFLVYDNPYSNYDDVYAYFESSGWLVDEQLNFYSIAILDMDEAVRVTNGGIYYRQDRVWVNDEGRWIKDVARCGEDGLLACGSYGTLLYGTRSGIDFTWNEAAESLGFGYLNSFSGTGCDDIWAGEYFNRVLHYDGLDWEMEFAPLNSLGPVYAMQTFGDGWVAAGASGNIALRDPDGRWQSIPQGTQSSQLFHALAPDSILSIGQGNFYVWNGIQWNDAGPISGTAYGLAATASKSVYALVYGNRTLLRKWDGTGFSSDFEIPGFYGQKLYASPETDVLYISGHMNAESQYLSVYRFENDEAVNITGDSLLPYPLVGMTEIRPGDLFILAQDQIWRWKDGLWSREMGLPTDEYFSAIWSHPDCGVFVEGHPTFFKDFSQE